MYGTLRPLQVLCWSAPASRIDKNSICHTYLRSFWVLHKSMCDNNRVLGIQSLHRLPRINKVLHFFPLIEPRILRPQSFSNTSVLFPGHLDKFLGFQDLSCSKLLYNFEVDIYNMWANCNQQTLGLSKFHRTLSRRGKMHQASPARFLSHYDPSRT